MEVRDEALIVDVGNLYDAASEAECNVVTITRERRTSHYAVANIGIIELGVVIIGLGVVIIELGIVITFRFLLANNAGIEHILA